LHYFLFFRRFWFLKYIMTDPLHNLRLCLLFISLILASCGVSEDKKSSSLNDSGVSVNNSILNKPDRSAEVSRRVEDFAEYKKTRNAKIFKAFKEKTLEILPGNEREAYRFIWIPSFESAVAIRVWQSKDKYFLTVKKAGGEGYEMKSLSHGSKRVLTEEEWAEFVRLIDEISFWNMSSIDIDEDPSFDGATYAVEGNKNNKFHEIHRITNTKEVRKIGDYLLKLTELKTGFDRY